MRIRAAVPRFSRFLAVFALILLPIPSGFGQPVAKPRENPELGIIGGDPVKPPKPLAEAPTGMAEVIALLSDDQKAKREHTPVGPSIFHRQMVRQAFLLAAREEFGLRVYDSDLGERVPEGLPADRQFRLRDLPATAERWTLVVGSPEAEHKLWAGEFIGDTPNPAAFAAWLAVHEKASRKLAAACLVATGFSAKPNPRTDAAVPRDIEDRLGIMRETEQFAAVRLLHAEMRSKGESDALLAALSRAYANLGLLTEFHWNAAPLAYKARGLLYAQRLAARNPGSAIALWHRAYAEALAGAHAAALVDLEAAAKIKDRPAAPDWVETIDAYLHFDWSRIEGVRTQKDSPLARLLQYLLDEEMLTPTSSIRTGRELLKDEQEIYRVHDGLARIGGVPHLHQATTEGPRIFSLQMPKRLKEMPDMPAPVIESLEEGNEVKYIAALMAAGAADRGEPTWPALGNIVREIRFTQTVNRLDFVAQRLAASTTQEARQARELFREHPLRAFIETYEINPVAKPAELRQKLAAAPLRELDLRAIAYFYRYSNVDLGAARQWMIWSAGRTEGLHYNDAPRLRYFHPNRVAQLKYATELRAVSPHSPIANAYYLAEAKPEYAANYPALEKQFADRAVVQKALGERYLAQKKFDDAARCWTRWVQLSPDLLAIQKLAGIYKTQGDRKKWLDTLEQSLKLEDTGMAHAQIRWQLATEFMNLGDFRKAEPYAIGAAEVGSEWGLVCLARCKVGLQQYEEANAILKAAADRYPSSVPFDWYLACRGCGKMDVAAAEKTCQAILARAGDQLPRYMAMKAGCYYQAAGKDDKALRAFHRQDLLEPNAPTRMFTALAAETVGDIKGRDYYFDLLANKTPGEAGYKLIGRTIAAWGKLPEPVDEATIKKFLDTLTPSGRADTHFFVG